jgi:hypothetical protein
MEFVLIIKNIYLFEYTKYITNILIIKFLYTIINIYSNIYKEVSHQFIIYKYIFLSLDRANIYRFKFFFIK